MKKITRYILLALLAILFLGTFVFLYQKSRPKAVRYEDIVVAVGDIDRSTIITGKIQPRNEVNVKPQINGIIAELYKEAGQMVQENEVIAKLKVIPDMNQLSSAESRVRLSELNLKQAQTNYEREKTLYDQNLVSQEEYDQVLQAY
ncbi:MAG: efflux transporter periplasmic adaptor subunit, partial [Bacteroidales bacterium]|nr:efflux transporter periplasmic adaptor subunit [Bacteroidales bacterium]